MKSFFQNQKAKLGLGMGLALLVFTGLFYFFYAKEGLFKSKISFYSWDNNFELDSTSYTFLTKNKVEHLHVKVAELDWNPEYNKVVVSNHIEVYRNFYGGSYFQGNTLTPVFFLKNDLFYHIDSTQIPFLASMVKNALRIHLVDLALDQRQLFEDRWSKFYFVAHPKQSNLDSLNTCYEKFLKNVVSYEFDCDWTEKTRDKYFYFLKNVKDTLNKEIESTLRLHQYKYRDKMGVPPVDRVNLMCYNVGEVKDIREQNSIFNSEVILSYVHKMPKYPLELNVAFPVFTWTILFRNNRFDKIIRGNILDKIDPSNLKKLDDNLYQLVNNDSYSWREPQLEKGDFIRIESVSMAEITALMQNITEQTEEKPKEIIFFDLNHAISKDNYDEMENAFSK